MGINRETLKILLYAKKKGADFSKVATIGRQNLRLNNREIFEVFNASFPNRSIKEVNFTQSDGYSEQLFKQLGAVIIDSFDYSDYEGANRIHDMNNPIDKNFKDKYTFVFDGGSLEHVFNFPVAIKNCMEMLEIGGYFIGINPANNQSGHGFYQFSPELYYRIFSSENGFEIVDVLAFKTKVKSAEIYRVKDPKVVGKRVVIGGLGATNICVVAKKIEKKDIFKKWPLQSDYKLEWSKENKKINISNTNNATLSQKLWNLVYQKIKNFSPIIIEPYSALEKLEI